MKDPAGHSSEGVLGPRVFGDCLRRVTLSAAVVNRYIGMGVRRTARAVYGIPVCQ